MEGFAYEKCPEKSSNFAKVNCSLLANPGGSMFIFLMYQFCLYVKRYQLYKKGIVCIHFCKYSNSAEGRPKPKS